MNKELASYFENLRNVLKQQGYDEQDIDQATVKESVPLISIVSWGLQCGCFTLTLLFVIGSLFLDFTLVLMLLYLVGALGVGVIGGLALSKTTTKSWKISLVASLGPAMAMTILPLLTFFSLVLDKTRGILTTVSTSGRAASTGVMIVNTLTDVLPKARTAAFLLFAGAVFYPVLLLVKKKQYKALALIPVGIIVCAGLYFLADFVVLTLFERILAVSPW